MSDEAKKIVAEAFSCGAGDVKYSMELKNGMTNDSVVFTVDGEEGRFILRIPGAGTDVLISRENEFAVYEKVLPLGICDDVVLLCKETGFKITRYWEDARDCDKDCLEDLAACMSLLRDFHGLGIAVQHEFCPFERIDYYESLLGGRPSRYGDYYGTKSDVMKLRGYVESAGRDRTLSHIDAVPSNFIMLPGGEIRLIDWEYAAMQDPHIDVAMFAVYAMFSKPQIDALVDIYFLGKATGKQRKKIYAYVAICGLLWSNWCEYKGLHGIEFGEYAKRQYGFAKEFCEVFAKCEG